MRDFLSNRAKNIKPSGIRRFFDIVSERKDVISLGVGEPDFITPWEIRDAGISAIKRGYTQYTSNKGLPELRKEISAYLKDVFSVDYSMDDMIITVGASEAIDLVFRATLNEGEEVLIPDPSYVSYKPTVELMGGVPVSIPCSGENGFKLTKEALLSVITDKTKALVFPYPNNPTGGIMSKEDIEEILPILIEHEILIVADEIYAELTYGKNHCSLASFPALKDRVVLISGFSKAFAMTGWRIGYVCANKEILSTMLKIHQYSIICAPIFSQYAALEGLKRGRANGYATVREMCAEYDKRRMFMYRTFTEMGLNCFEPEGAFYIFPCVKSTGMTGEQFATKLLESKQVAVVPGDAFGDFGRDYVRCSYAYSMKDLAQATQKIAEFVKEIKG
ncbi:MAG: aminotransferase class I/II-fold pyridoxal phosphate-dependent enzyme [Clostridia bacterium]|nr:aminotransferase class I/II-fold pyridoxal phosphate-dependent enzyme [Clostridia bacterium]